MRRVTIRPDAGLEALAALLLCLCAPLVMAQSLEPRAYLNVPVGMNFLIAGYDYTSGSVAVDPSVPLTDAHITTNTALLAFAHSFGVWSKSAKFDVVWPMVSLSGSANYDGQPKTRDVTGPADPAFKISVNFHGAPAMNFEQFRGYRQDLIVGASLRVTAPWGQYDSSRLVNIGTNRWSFKPELGVSKALGVWSFDVAAATTFFTGNNDFLNGGTTQQDPLYSLQAHAIRNFPRGVWVAGDATYYWGARMTVNGRQTDTLQANSRFGVTVAVPVNRRNSVKFFGIAGVSSRTRSNADIMGILWQYRWGPGL